MKFIHTSDWHLGRIFHNMNLLEDQKFLLNEIIKQVNSIKPDAFLISGDIYDRAIPPADAVGVLNDFLEVLCFDYKIPVLLIPGNHDSPERLNFGSRMMKESGLHIFGDTTNLTSGIEIKGVQFFGIPYSEPEIIGSQFGKEFKSSEEMMDFLCGEILNSNREIKNKVLLSHCFVSGGNGSDSERLLSVGGSEMIEPDIFKEFSYVALGHLHAPQIVKYNHVRYSGSLMKYSFSEESHIKGITLVDFGGTKPDITEIPLSPLRDLKIETGKFDEILKKFESLPKKDDFYLIRLTDENTILEPMERLRSVLPNVLQIEKIKFQNRDDTKKIAKNFKTINEIEMIRDFIKYQSGKDLSDEELKIVNGILNSIKEQ